MLPGNTQIGAGLLAARIPQQHSHERPQGSSDEKQLGALEKAIQTGGAFLIQSLTIFGCKIRYLVAMLRDVAPLLVQVQGAIFTFAQLAGCNQRSTGK